MPYSIYKKERQKIWFVWFEQCHCSVNPALSLNRGAMKSMYFEVRVCQNMSLPAGLPAVSCLLLMNSLRGPKQMEIRSRKVLTVRGWRSNSQTNCLMGSIVLAASFWETSGGWDWSEENLHEQFGVLFQQRYFNRIDHGWSSHFWPVFVKSIIPFFLK